MDALEGIEEYVHLLSDKEKEFLNTFLEETVITNFQHKGKHLYKSKKKRREFYGDNNARNRCIYTKAKAMQGLISFDNPDTLTAVIDRNQSDMNIEDQMIALIGIKRSGILKDSEE